MTNRAIVVAGCGLLAVLLSSCRATTPAPDDQSPPASYVPCVSRGAAGVADAPAVGVAVPNAASPPDGANVPGASLARTVRETVLVPDVSEAEEKSIAISPDNRH